MAISHTTVNIDKDVWLIDLSLINYIIVNIDKDLYG